MRESCTRQPGTAWARRFTTSAAMQTAHIRRALWFSTKRAIYTEQPPPEATSIASADTPSAVAWYSSSHRDEAQPYRTGLLNLAPRARSPADVKDPAQIAIAVRRCSIIQIRILASISILYTC